MKGSMACTSGGWKVVVGCPRAGSSVIRGRYGENSETAKISVTVDTSNKLLLSEMQASWQHIGIFSLQRSTRSGGQSSFYLYNLSNSLNNVRQPFLPLSLCIT